MNEPFKLYVRNSKYNDTGASYEYTAMFREMEYLDLTGIDGLMVQYTGLSPSAAVIYTAGIASQNGSMFQSSRLNTRNIVLTFTMFRNIEDIRRLLYKFFSTGEKVTLYYRGTRNAEIDGYVETISVNQFAETAHRQVMQVSILCPDPLLRSPDETVISFNTGSYTFAYVDVNYGGEYKYGIKVHIAFSMNTTNPVIANQFDNGKFVRVVGTFTANDTLDICTIQGQKSVIKTTTSGGAIAKYNMINDVELTNLGWTQVYPDYNKIGIVSVSGTGMTGTITIREVYGGV